MEERVFLIMRERDPRPLQLPQVTNHTGNAINHSLPPLLVQVLVGLGIGFFLGDKDLVIFDF